LSGTRIAAAVCRSDWFGGAIGVGKLHALSTTMLLKPAGARVAKQVHRPAHLGELVGVKDYRLADWEFLATGSSAHSYLSSGLDGDRRDCLCLDTILNEEYDKSRPIQDELVCRARIVSCHGSVAMDEAVSDGIDTQHLFGQSRI
jgi:hypothetical protein